MSAEEPSGAKSQERRLDIVEEKVTEQGIRQDLIDVKLLLAATKVELTDAIGSVREDLRPFRQLFWILVATIATSFVAGFVGLIFLVFKEILRASGVPVP